MISSAQDYLRTKRQLSNDIDALKQKPQQFNALATRLKNNEPGASDEIVPLLEETHSLRNRMQEKFRVFSDPNSDRFASNSAQKRTEQRQFKFDIEKVLEDIKNAETNLVNSEKQAIQEYNNSRQLVSFDDDDATGGNPFSPFQHSGGNARSENTNFQSSNIGNNRQTQASIQLDNEMLKRQQDMERVERDITNVNLIYKELNTLVYQQAELVDNIENHIETADLQVEEGIEQLGQAANHAVALRKKKLCLTMFCIAAIITIILILIISIKTR